MTRDNILDMINGARDSYVLAAIESRKQPPKRNTGSRRLLLIAAAIALALLLVGCVSVCLWLQDRSIGQETYTRYFDEQGRCMDPTERIRDIVTFADTPGQQAAKEWYEFQQTYDPERKLLTNEPDIPEIHNAEEVVYGCYTPEMVEKLHEIAEKYDLKLLDAYTGLQKWQGHIGLKALGVATMLKDSADARMREVSGLLYPPYDFKLEYHVELTGANALWKEDMLVVQYYHRNGYFPRDAVSLYDLQDYQQWRYTTADGTELLLAQSSKGAATILADLGHGVMTIHFDSYNGPSLYPQPHEIITKEGLEQVVEVFEYQLPFEKMDVAAIQPELDAAEAAWWAENPPRTLPTYPDFDGYMERAGIWLGQEGYDYCFHDWDENGSEDLLISRNGWLNRVITMENGETSEKYFFSQRICEDGVRYMLDQYEFSTFRRHVFYGEDGPFLTLTFYDGSWYQGREPMDRAGLMLQPVLTEEEVQTLIDQYPPLELPWQSILTYALADGRSMADLVAEFEAERNARPPLTGEALRQAYAEKAQEYAWYRYYAIRDINGDGVEDLLLSEKEDCFDAAFTTEYGEISGLDTGRVGDTYLCENNVVEILSINGMEDGVELDMRAFCRLSPDQEPELLDYTFYNKATGSWQSDLDGTSMTETDAHAILNRYSRIPLNLRPISELIG